MIVNGNQLHCKQSTYNLGQITRLAKRIGDPETRRYMADMIVSRRVFEGGSESIDRSVNHALRALNDTRRV